MKNYAIILASGSGIRYGASIPKQFVKIAGKTILEHTIDIFEKTDEIDEILLVINPDYRCFTEEILLKNSYKKISKLINGGKTRKDSSYVGINAIEDTEANVIIHDCVRPFLSQRIIKDCLDALQHYRAVDVAIPSTDTIVEVDKDNFIKHIPNRESLRSGQTPQCFKLSIIKKAHELSKDETNFTDDCGLILKHNLSEVYVIEGDIENIKITYQSDVFLADKLFQIRQIIHPDNNIENIKDKVIVIFGGTKGIGEKTAELAEKYGAKVFATSSSMGCDITDFDSVDSFLKKVYADTNRIDLVINTAGVLKIGKLTDRKIDDVISDISVNYIGAVNVAKAAIPYLKESQGSLQLYTSSSYTRGRALYSTYSSSKAAIVNLSQALAEELMNDKVRINVINPERCATPMRLQAFGQEPEDTLLKPEKVAEASLKTFLSNLTGQVVDVRK